MRAMDRGMEGWTGRTSSVALLPGYPFLVLIYAFVHLACSVVRPLASIEGL
jgi:hypothetical protein